MNFDFEKTIDRRNTCSAKWDGLEEKFGLRDASDAVSMWIADMDFACPPEVVQAVQQTVEHPAYGYRFNPPEVPQAICLWQKKRFDLTVAPDELVYGSTVLAILAGGLQSMTRKGEGVIIQSPVYYPFAACIRDSDRVVVDNPLIEEERDGKLTYSIDFDGLRTAAAREDVTAMIFCNPHNPAGRIWSPEEQRKVAEICCQNGVFLIVDEIHADLVIGRNKMVPFMKACADHSGHAMSIMSTSKTFNVAGVHAAYGIIPNEEIRQKVKARMGRNRSGEFGYLGAAAVVAAYNHCDYYVEGLCKKLEQNAQTVYNFCRERLPQVRVAELQGTYLMWLDFTRLGVPKEKVERFLLDEAGVILDPGVWFSEKYMGYGRMNIATSNATVVRALEKLEKAIKAL